MQRPQGFSLIVRCGAIAGPKAHVVKREEWDFQALETPRDGAKVNDSVSCVSWIMHVEKDRASVVVFKCLFAD